MTEDRDYQNEHTQFTVIRWAPHELKLAAFVVLVLVALLSFTAGAMMG